MFTPCFVISSVEYVLSALLKHYLFLCEISDSVIAKITVLWHRMFIVYFYFIYTFFLSLSYKPYYLGSFVSGHGRPFYNIRY
jgi:hypothetical protein